MMGVSPASKSLGDLLPAHSNSFGEEEYVPFLAARSKIVPVKAQQNWSKIGTYPELKI